MKKATLVRRSRTLRQGQRGMACMWLVGRGDERDAVTRQSWNLAEPQSMDPTLLLGRDARDGTVEVCDMWADSRHDIDDLRARVLLPASTES